MTGPVQPNAVKERVRGPNLAVFVKNRLTEGVPMEEALRRVDEAGLVIASNRRLSQALLGSNEGQGISNAFTCWTGTMTAYDEPDKRLGKTIEYTDKSTGITYVFPVPKEHVGKKNVVLVVEHPDFTLDIDGKIRIVRAKDVGIVAAFPPESEMNRLSEQAWYLGDPKYDIPAGNEADRSIKLARFPLRIDKRVGLIARGDDDDVRCNGRLVYLNIQPSVALGVAAEAKSE